MNFNMATLLATALKVPKLEHKEMILNPESWQQLREDEQFKTTDKPFLGMQIHIKSDRSALVG